jgi:ribonuclease HI
MLKWLKRGDVLKYNIYTDGACSGNPGPGGWSVVFLKKDGYDTLSGGEKSTTNNRMELYALSEALILILEHWWDNENSIYELYSDSAYVVNSINNNWLYKWFNNGWLTTKGHNIKNKDLWIEVYNSLKIIKELDINLTITKVKGHSDNTFNDLADKLAVKESNKRRAK